jgi:hypothetical protein
MAPTGEMMSWQTRLQSSAASSGAVSVNMSAISNRPCVFVDQHFEMPHARRITCSHRLSPLARKIAFPARSWNFSGDRAPQSRSFGHFPTVSMCELNS